MSERSYSFTFTPTEKTITAALKARPPKGFPKAKGAGWATGLRLLQCVLLGLGSVGAAVVLGYLASGTLSFPLWGFAAGIVLLYIAVFGSIFITLPVLSRSALATRANQGPVTIRFDPEGLSMHRDRFKSEVKWSGLEGVTRNKVAFVFWLGGTRPSLPFGVFDSPEQADAFEKDVQTWLEASR